MARNGLFEAGSLYEGDESKDDGAHSQYERPNEC